jgi:hypothetical protein
MLEQKIRNFSESLARGIDRRAFLRRSGGAVAASISALVLGPLLANSPSRASAGTLLPNTPNCAPPGPYCNLEGGSPPQPDACRGAECFQHNPGSGVVACHVYYAFYQVGCWTSGGSGGYWTCCDCQCNGGSTCGCAQFHPTNAPIPE